MCVELRRECKGAVCTVNEMKMCGKDGGGGECEDGAELCTIKEGPGEGQALTDHDADCFLQAGTTKKKEVCNDYRRKPCDFLGGAPRK